MKVKTIGNSFNMLYRKWIRELNCLNGVHSGINLCHRIHPCWYQPSRNVYIPEQKPAGPKYTRAQNDDITMSHTPHGYFKPYNFQTGLTFPSLPMSKTTSVSSPWLLSPPYHLFPTSTSDPILPFLAPKYLSICSHHPVPTVVPAMEATMTSGKQPLNWSCWFPWISQTTHTLPRREIFLNLKSDHTFFTGSLCLMPDMQGLSWYLHLQPQPRSHC